MPSSLIHQSKVVQAQLRTDIPDFKVGSVVNVYYKIKEGNKERVQLFSGLVTNRHAVNSLDATFTVLKNSTSGVKVERVFPLHTPAIEKVEVVSFRRARKANIRYLRKIKDPIKTLKTKTVKVLAA